jgi:membrane peptidoglycan carboxypeptidase
MDTESACMDDWSPRSGPLAMDDEPTTVTSPVRPARRRRRWPRRLVGAVLGTVAVFVLGFVVLFLVTPGVGDAGQRVAALDTRYGVAVQTTPVAVRFADALTATEDSRFYSDHGVDPRSLVRVVWAMVSGNTSDGGGATLDQQLAKELYGNGVSTGPVSIAEQMTLAVKLDTSYSKARILEMYASVVYFGDGYYGLNAASHGYFGVSADQLTWGQAALLAGLVQAPSADDPVHHLSVAQGRERHVLGRLVATGQLDQATADAAAAAPLHLIANHGS